MRLAIALAFAACASGCAGLARISAGPTVDTEGHVGGEIKATLGFGIVDVLNPSSQRLMLTGVASVSGGVGPAARGATGAFSYSEGVGLLGPPIGARAPLQPHAEGVIIFRGAWPDVPPSATGVGIGARVAVLYNFRGHDVPGLIIVQHRFLAIGPEIEADYFVTGRHEGLFAFDLTLEVLDIWPRRYAR